MLCSGKYIGDQKAKKLLGVELTSTGLIHDTSLGVYFPDISKLACKTDLGSINLGYSISRLFKNSACTQDLKTAPEDGQTYYFTITLKHADGEYENAINNSNSSIKITGFSDCKVVKAEADPGYGTEVWFSIRYDKASASSGTTITTPDGTITNPDGTITTPDGTTAPIETDATEPQKDPVATKEAETEESVQPSNAMPWWGLLIIVTVACLILGGTVIAVVLILKKKQTP